MAPAVSWEPNRVETMSVNVLPEKDERSKLVDPEPRFCPVYQW